VFDGADDGTSMPFESGFAPAVEARLVGDDFDKDPVPHPGVADVRFDLADFHARNVWKTIVAGTFRVPTTHGIWSVPATLPLFFVLVPSRQKQNQSVWREIGDGNVQAAIFAEVCGKAHTIAHAGRVEVVVRVLLSYFLRRLQHNRVGQVEGNA